MSYLNFEEFEDLTKSDISVTDFDKLLPKACAVLDHATNHHYSRVDIETDNPWRVSQFKRALCAQIEYFYETGASTYEGINNEPQSFTAGRTTVSKAGRHGSTGPSESKSLIAEDVYVYLEGTGLLYSGVGVVK